MVQCQDAQDPTFVLWQELDDRLQEQVVQKNHLLQVLNKEDLEGTALLRIRYTCIVVIHVNVFFHSSIGVCI